MPIIEKEAMREHATTIRKRAKELRDMAKAERTYGDEHYRAARQHAQEAAELEREAERLDPPPDNGYCHAGRDGECNWQFCPQEANGRANYQTTCPRKHYSDDE